MSSAWLSPFNSAMRRRARAVSVSRYTVVFTICHIRYHIWQKPRSQKFGVRSEKSGCGRAGTLDGLVESIVAMDVGLDVVV